MKLILPIFLLLLGCSDQGTDLDEENQAREESTPVDSSIKPASSDGETFGGYDCTVDCSGHEAGYKWAQEKGINDTDDCGGNSESFIEGCKAYAEEQKTSNEQ